MITSLLALPMLAFQQPALAADEPGIPVTIRVLDAANAAVPTAVVRHPDEKDPHRVNSETGEWSTSYLYLPNGEELIFEKGMELSFEISAPGYLSVEITYEVKKRRNVATVNLQKMDLSLDSDDDDDDVIIQFGRDKPRD